MKGIPLIRSPRRWWMPAVAVAVLAITGLAVYRLHGGFTALNVGITSTGSGIANNTARFNPKRVTLEVFGDAGASASINYVDANVQPKRVRNASLPWSLTIVTTQPAAFSNLVAQASGNSVGCRITVDGKVKDERIVNELNGLTFCLAKSA